MKKEIDSVILELKHGLEKEKKFLLEMIKNNIKKECESLNPTVYIGLINIENIEIAKLSNIFASGKYRYFNSGMLNLYNFTVYIEANYSDILKLIEENKIYTGYYIDDIGSKYAFNYRLIFNNSFLDCEKELEDFLYQNNLKTFPYFNPYARKMFDVKVENIIDRVDIEKINIKSIDLGDISLDYKISLNTCPVWNIDMENDVVLALSVIPDLKDKLYCIQLPINDEYSLLTKSKKAKIHHIVKGEELQKIYFDKEISSWDICKIYQNIGDIEMEGKYINNYFNDSCINLGSHKLLSKIELNRILKLLCKNLELEYLGYLLEIAKSDKVINKYIKNFKYPQGIIKDFIRFEEKRKKIYLKFKKQSSPLFEDKINFILAYMDSIYEDINWNGVYND